MSSSIHKQVLNSGISQLVVGGLCILFGIAEIATTFAARRITISLILFVAIWAGVWICVTGIIGIIAARTKRCSFRCMIGVYMGFSITSIVFTCIMITSYSFTISWNDHNFLHGSVQAYVVISLLMLILSIVEFFIAIWACVCCCINGPCCGRQQSQTPTFAQAMYIQDQRGPPTAYVIVQGPEGRPVAVPAQAGGPMTGLSGTPISNQNYPIGTSIPPHYQPESDQQSTEDQVKVIH